MHGSGGWSSVGILTLSHAGYVALDHVLVHSESQFPHQQNGLDFTSQDWCIDWKQCL